MTVKNRQQTGFILLETLPALLLVLAVLIVVMNSERIRLRLLENDASKMSKTSAYDEVSSKWAENPNSKAALSTWSGADGWDVIDFPDENWLPPISRNTNQSSLWRRQLENDKEGHTFWRIEVFNARAGKWRWWIEMKYSDEANTQ